MDGAKPERNTIIDNRGDGNAQNKCVSLAHQVYHCLTMFTCMIDNI